MQAKVRPLQIPLQKSRLQPRLLLCPDELVPVLQGAPARPLLHLLGLVPRRHEAHQGGSKGAVDRWVRRATESCIHLNPQVLRFLKAQKLCWAELTSSDGNTK